MSNRDLMIRIDTATAKAYSRDRYNSWSSCIKALLNRGYSEKETAAFLLSKVMRWAADNSDARYGEVTSNDMLRYIDKPSNRINRQYVASLVSGTFGE
jgi:hypothetical protein